jgi:hypothetical protein
LLRGKCHSGSWGGDCTLFFSEGQLWWIRGKIPTSSEFGTGRFKVAPAMLLASEQLESDSSNIWKKTHHTLKLANAKTETIVFNGLMSAFIKSKLPLYREQ